MCFISTSALAYIHTSTKVLLMFTLGAWVPHVCCQVIWHEVRCLLWLMSCKFQPISTYVDLDSCYGPCFSSVIIVDSLVGERPYAQQ